VVLVSPSCRDAYYVQEEIQRGVALERRDPRLHRIVGVLLPGARLTDLPYGLRIKQAIPVGGDDYSIAADKLRDLLHLMRRTSWEDYAERLFSLRDYTVAYIPFLNRPGPSVAELHMEDLDIIRDSSCYELPNAFASTRVDSTFSNDPNCRLSSFELRSGPHLRLTLSRTTYGDYLKSNEHLDDPLPGDPLKTLRDAFGSQIPSDSGGDLRGLELSNICGVGIFVVSRDHYILVTRHSDKSHVYPGRLTFSASGTIRWGVHPHPFTMIIYKAFEEVRHQVNPSMLRMIGFGVDARRLYFQFSFCERTAADMADIKELCPSRSRPRLLPFEIGPIADSLVTECWEPAAEAALLTLCTQSFGFEEVASELEKRRDLWPRRAMQDEWDDRASRQGLLADLSVRYAVDQIKVESERFVGDVMSFIGDDVRGKNTLELGAGTGRLTERLVDLASALTCVDLCERMLDRNRARLGARADRVKYVRCFAQDYRPTGHHDVVVCSQVLIHNVTDEQFNGVVATMCASADTLFVIEDVTEGRPTSPHTRLHSKKDLVRRFAGRGFKLERETETHLFDDRVALLKLVRRPGSTRTASSSRTARGREAI
jgi:SAM-dependent methyltransferase